MNLNNAKVKTLADESGQSVEQLAGALAREGFSQPAAEKALKNWMGGRNHPRAKFEDMRRLAGALGVEPKMRVEPTRPGEITRYVADISKARRLLGYEPSDLL